MRIDDPPPGDEVQVDFGEMGFVTDAEGKRRKLWVLVVTLSMSRYMFVWPTFAQTMAAVCEGFDAAWRFFGGVPKRIVPDNMTSIVMRADPSIRFSTSVPRVRTGARLLRRSRACTPTARQGARRKSDRLRARALVRRRAIADDERARDAEHGAAMSPAPASTARRDEYRARCSRPRRSPSCRAPTAPFDVPTWTSAKIHPDHHAQVGRALYSLPTRFIGKTLDVRVDRSTVRFYVGAELVKMHARVEPGKRSTDPNDYPVGKADYALRSVDGVKRRAREHGEHIGDFAERLLGGALPWVKLRPGYGLLRLCERYGKDRVDALCARALAFDVIDVPRIERMLKSAMQSESEGRARQGDPLPPSRFARDPSAFATMTKPSKGGA